MDSIRKQQVTSRINNTPYEKRFFTAYPELFKHAIKVEKYPNAHLDRYSTGSTVPATWSCSQCQTHFERNWAETTKRQYVLCPECVQLKIKNRITYGTAQNDALTLRVKAPHIYKTLKSATNHNGIILDISKISHKSSKAKGIWECQACHKDFTSIVRARVKANHVYCSSCSKTGQSLFEYELACLLEASLQTKVTTHHTKQKGISKIDLYIPKYDTGIQVDPHWSHQYRLEQDKRNHEKHKKQYTTIIRFREEPLIIFDNAIPVPPKLQVKDWHSLILETLKLPYEIITPDETQKVLIKANKQWGKSFIEKAGNLSTQPFFKEYVRNISHPERNPKAVGGSSADKCLWKCVEGHEWEATIDTRNSKGRACPACSLTKRRTASTNKSIAVLHPESLDEFVKNLSSDRTPYELKETAGDICVWKCHICGTLIKLGVWSRMSTLARYRQGKNHYAHVAKTLV